MMVQERLPASSEDVRVSVDDGLRGGEGGSLRGSYPCTRLAGSGHLLFCYVSDAPEPSLTAAVRIMSHPGRRGAQDRCEWGASGGPTRPLPSKQKEIAVNTAPSDRLPYCLPPPPLPPTPPPPSLRPQQKAIIGVLDIGSP